MIEKAPLVPPDYDEKKELDALHQKVGSMINFGWNLEEGALYKKGFSAKIINSLLKTMGMSTDAYFNWVNDKSDWRRYEFPLTDKSLIFDVGGFDGKWAAKMFEKYGCKIHVFEPVKSFYDDIVSLFNNVAEIKSTAKKNVVVHNFGLSDEDKDQNIYLAGDASTIYLHNENAEKIKLVDFNAWIEENKIECIDLMKQNLEGGEYALLMSIIKAGNHTKIKNILVQFHRFPEYYESYREAIHNELKKTHELTFCYDFIWENWTLKEK